MKKTDEYLNNYCFKIFNFKNPEKDISSENILPADFHMIIFVVSGILTISRNQTYNTFKTQDLIIIPNNIKFEIHKSKSNIRFYIIGFSPKLLMDTNIEYRLKYHLLSNQNFIVVSIEEEDIYFIQKIFKIIYMAHKGENYILQKDLLRVGINFLIQKKIKIQGINEKSLNQKQKIILNFFNTLQQNFKKEHQVKFYADHLCITAGYLNKITKELTNKSVKNLIEEMILEESKILLNNNKCTISEIADTLNFKSSASFSNFFKKHTSFSPSQYRLKNV